MDVTKQLQTIGLNDKEAKIYHTCLKLGEATAFEIARISGIKRATVYFTLDTLIENSWITVKETKKAKVYLANDPNRISNILETRQKELASLVPQLSDIYNLRFSRPKVQVFEGKEGVKVIYEEILNNIKDYEILVIGSSVHLDLPEFKPYLERWQMALRRGFKAREIVSNDASGKKYLQKQKLVTKRNPHYQIKLSPEDNLLPRTETVIYGDKVAIFSHQTDGLFVTLITAQHMADSYRSWFEMAWQTV